MRNPTPSSIPNKAPAAIDRPPASAEELGALIRRAEGGDESAVAVLRRVLADPQAVEILGGNLAEGVGRALLVKFCGKDRLAREAITRKMELLRAELGGSEPSAVERLLVERAVLCWLLMHHLEFDYARQAPAPPALGLHYQKVIDRAHKRYLTALNSTALVFCRFVS